MEQWIFVLLCLSLVGELVFGSIFPPVSPGTSSPTVPSQQEVTWSPESLVTIQGMMVGEEKIYTQVLHAEDAGETNAESGRNSAAVLPKDTVVGPDQKPVDETAAAVLPKDTVVGPEQKPADETAAAVLPNDTVVGPEQKPVDKIVVVTTIRNNSETETKMSLHPPSG